MKTSQLILGACSLVAIPLVHAGATTTTADGCLQAMTTGSSNLYSAQTWCATYTTMTYTYSTGFPVSYTSACGLNPTKYSSACSRLPKPTPPLSGCGNDQIVKNGAFECSLASWKAETRDPGTTYAVNEPGRSGALYSYSLWVYQNQPPVPGTGREQASINQDVKLTVGKKYTLKFSTYFDNADAGFIGIMLNSKAVKTVDAHDNPGPNRWNDWFYTFTADKATTNLRFEFLFSTVATARLDDISISCA